MSRRVAIAMTAIILAATAPSRAGLRTWTPSGPSTSFVGKVFVDARIAGTVYTISDGQLFCSRDAGTHWLLLLSAVYSFALDAAHPATIFAGTGNRLLRSDDAGATWVDRSPVLDPSMVILNLLVDPKSLETIYASSFGGASSVQAHRSDNGGQTWAALPLPAGAHLAQIAADGTLFAVSDNAIFTSSNRGETFKPVAGTLPTGVYQIADVVADPADPSTIYVLSGGGLFRSQDRGLSFARLGRGVPQQLAIAPSNPSILYAAGLSGGVWKSSDGGVSWSFVGGGIRPSNSVFDRVFAIAVDPRDADFLYVGTSAQGLFKSTDGGASWTSISRGFRGRPVTAMAADTADPRNVYVATVGFTHYGGARIFRSADAGSSWSDTGDSEFPRVNALATDPTGSVLYEATGLCFFSACSGGVAESRDRGKSWSSLLDLHRFVSAIGVDPFRPGTLFADHLADINPNRWQGLRSTDGGQNWTALAGFPETQVSQFLFEAPPSGAVYAVSFDAGVFKSSDGGNSWSPSSSGLPVDARVSGLALVPSSHATLWIGTSKGLFRSSDEGTSWSATSFTDPVSAIAIEPRRGLIFVASAGQISWSDDAGTFWTPIGGTFSTVVRLLLIDPAGPSIFAAPDEGGVFRLSLLSIPRVISPR